MGTLSGIRKTGTTALTALLSTAVYGAAMAQSVRLPDINVTETRLTGIGRSVGTGGQAEPGPADGPPSGTVGGIAVGGAGITGASTTVITGEDIERSPEQTLQGILSREPGVQVQSLFGGVNGARTTVDMRGFGAAANSNTLFLINGRRVQDLDMVGVDLAALPRESIERIEITRGNSGAVLYGDGAVGGVINIITKTGVGTKPGARIDGGFGSFNYREGNLSAWGSNGAWSGSIFTNAIRSDGYRENNEYKQFGGVADIRYTYDQGSVYLNLSVDDQHLGLPGARRYSPSEGLFPLITDRRGAFTPFDWADKQGQNGTVGFTHRIAPGVEIIVDGGVRRKEEQSQYFLSTDFAPPTMQPRQAVDTTLTTSSVTPRVKIDTQLWGMPIKATGGFDYIDADYHSERPLYFGAAPINVYDLGQTSQGWYWMQTIAPLPGTEISGGARTQRTSVNARDKFDATAPGGTSCFFGFCFPNGIEGVPLDQSETNHAWHLGMEQRVGPHLALFGRMAQSFRVPNVDERVGMVTAQVGIPTTFDLRTQKSHDWEAGVRVNAGPLEAQWSYYNMNLTDEIHFRFGPNFEANNINLDPTRRYGHETIVSYRVSDDVRLKGGLAYTRAVFREGLFAGNDVPLVSRWTGNVALSWDIWRKWLTLDTVVRYFGDRRMDNDQANLQPMIPSYTTVDVRLGGRIEQFFWSVAVLNLFNEEYFDYAIASPYPYGFASRLGTYNAYPQPGRTFMVKAGMTW
ncbi:MAG: TonB-dependent receptor [Pseudorhodoplanes sp.]